ncbi:MAG: hypothetical protein NZ580_08055 [Bacteroidia bacterium]|nr:hypothetical protein [Bacteroidia bacterium]MDW8236700.1 beta-ketoacyl synthase N-terminal-like domain-containing protein [Bacteroidia bacterium]
MKPRAVGIAWLRSWPGPEALQGEWSQAVGKPAFRLSPEASDLPRTQTLLEAFLEEYLHELRSYAPQALCMGTARGELVGLLHGYEFWARTGQSPPPTLSTATSLGSLATYTARKLHLSGPAWTVSQTCISGMVALYTAALLIEGGVVERAAFGAVEAPLHPFYAEAMNALRIYTRRQSYPYVSPGSGENTFAIAEAVGIGILTNEPAPIQISAIQLGTAYPTELPSYTAVSVEALERLLRTLGEKSPDFVLLHAPGTRQGDTAEIQAVQKVWGEVPAVSIKALTGHSLGAAPIVSLNWACHMLVSQQWPQVPPPALWMSSPPQQWENAVVIALGFGGVMSAVRIQKNPDYVPPRASPNPA